MIKIQKKNGSLQDFDPNKIIAAVKKSSTRVGVELSESQFESLLRIILEHLKDLPIIEVKELHNIVELSLDEVDARVAKSYRDYRNYKLQFVKMLDEVYRKKLELNNIQDASNANADSMLITTQKSITYAELNGELYKKFFLTDEENLAQQEGYIYIHDKGSRLDTSNCTLFDMKSVLTGGFEMGNIHYNEPKSIEVAFSVMLDIIFNAGSSQYGGFTVSEIDKLLSPYAEKSYNLYLNEFEDIIQGKDPTRANLYATSRLRRVIEQKVQSMDMKLNSCETSRGDYIFTSISFGLAKDRFGQMISSAILKVRREGQGREGYKRPVLFPKLTFLYDENLHGEGRELEWLFLEAVDCTMRAQYPDFLSMSGDGYAPSIYKKYEVTISRMGCRANLSPWYERGGIEPADEKDIPVYEGRFNMGAISLNLPMIVAKSKEEGLEFYSLLEYYLDLIRKIHLRTLEYFSHKKAGINPLMFCQGGSYRGYKKPDEELGLEFLRPCTVSFGITALNEATVMYKGKTIREDNSQFAREVLEFINSYANKYKKIDKALYAIYGTPSETLSSLQVKQFRAKYGIVEGVSDRDYFSNSFHLHVSEDVTPIEKQDYEYNCFHLCNGGNIMYNRFTSEYNKEAYIVLIRRAMKLGYYYGCNLSKDYCRDCGFEFIDKDYCPKCGSDNLVRISRICGYLGFEKIGNRTRMNQGKLAEIADRKSM